MDYLQPPPDVRNAVTGRKISYARGVLKNRHPNGIDIYMYLDTPGVYLTGHATPVSEKMAGEAGYDTVAYKSLRIRQTREKEFLSKLDLELAAGLSVRRVIAEKGGYKVIELSKDRHQILGPDDKPLSPMPFVLEEALNILNELSPDEEIEAPAPEKKSPFKSLGQG